MKMNLKNLRPGDLFTSLSEGQYKGHILRVRSVSLPLVFIDRWSPYLPKTSPFFLESQALDTRSGEYVRVSKNTVPAQIAA